MPNRISKPLFCIIICSFFSFISCGGGGGGSSSSPSPPRFNISSTQIAFGNVLLGNSYEQVVTIKNIGSQTLNIGQFTPLSSPYSITNNNCSGKGLTASQTCTFKVQFYPNDPTSQGQELKASFDVPSNDSIDNTVTVNVSGKPEGLRVSIIQDYTLACPNIGVVLSVSDKNGIPVDGLGINNIEFFENSVKQENISISPALSTIPTSVALVLDTSDTMTNFQPDVKVASEYFVGLLKTDDEAEIIRFAKTYELKQSFTTDKNALVSAINNDYTGCIYATLLYDALWYAIDTTSNRPNNRSIVVISDGKDEDKGYCGVNTGGSVKTLTDVINHANENQVSIFTIGIGSPISGNVMTDLAINTGGHYFSTPNSDQLINIYEEIRSILDGQYVITYDSSLSGNNIITVDVKVFNVFDLILNANLQGQASRQIQGCP